MGLLHSYNDTNKVTYRGLAIRYRVEPNTDSGGLFNNGYIITRYATKSYAYVGMDYSTANACASSKRSQYTRRYACVYTNDNNQLSTMYVTECPVDIAPMHDDGDMWSVQIDVSETDQKATSSAPSNPASLFADENGRNYDENGGGGGPTITLNHVRVAEFAVIVSYTQNIPDFAEDQLVLMYRDSEQGEWAMSNYPWTDVPQPTGERWYQLMYGTITSNTILEE